MSQVLSLVRGTVEEDKVESIQTRYAAGVAGTRPPGLAATWLLRGAGGTIAIATLWTDRAALDAMVATGEEPFARKLIREAGGTPNAEFFEVLEGSS